MRAELVLFFTCARWDVSGPMARFITVSGVSSIQSEPALALVDDSGSNAEGATRTVVAIRIPQNSNGS